MMQWILLILSAWVAWAILCRLWALDWRHHRPGVVLGYVLVAAADVLAGSAAAQGEAGALHVAIVLMVGTHLALSSHAWDGGVPEIARRE